MNVQSKRGGAVHASITGTPSCNPWQVASKFRKTTADVTCKACIRRGYAETHDAQATQAEAPEAPEAPEERAAAAQDAPEVHATVHPGRCFCRKFAPGHAPGLHSGWVRCTGDVARHDPAACPACAVSGSALCAYSAAHTMAGVEATTLLDCGPIGLIPACGQCVSFYTHVA